ncbi:hypothetical protein EV03_1924 [Prochlorococcus marinus str. PAC1]|uniref:Uncharacterized protein n=1 Tax=Prochlorococcus marinus str. PAC1 TaxID=59924 RepID=A0A0A2C4L8_PROMR|nr:hypothetical protein EV03_1924 [Prochlorococcus marinus str. PAC1]
MKKEYVYLKKLRSLSNRLMPQNSYSMQQKNRGGTQQRRRFTKVFKCFAFVNSNNFSNLA